MACLYFLESLFYWEKYMIFVLFLIEKMEYFFGRQEAKVKSANEKKMIFSENSFGRAGGWPQALKHTQNL